MILPTNQRGFSLLEIMLVTAIMVLLATMAISALRTQAVNTRIEKTAAQMQQILQAAVAYYTDNNTWPSCDGSTDNTQFDQCQIQTLIDKGYLQVGTTVLNSPWGNPYESAWATMSGHPFQLRTDVTDPNFATVLSSLLPLASASSTMLTTFINVPSYAYSSALSLQKTAIYMPGQAIPAPACPTNMQATVAVLPEVVSGTVQLPSGDSSPVTYPIQSFYAYALGDASTGSPVIVTPAVKLPICPAVKNTDTVCSSPAGCWTACIGGKAGYGNSFYTYVLGSGSSLQITAMTYCAPKKSNPLQGPKEAGTPVFKN